MKHLKCYLTTLLLVYSCFISAQDFEMNGICYKVTSDTDRTVSVTKHPSGYFDSLVIPETVSFTSTVYRVDAIADEAFFSCSGVTSITLPNGLTKIGKDAFSSCSGLTEIIFPDCLVSIGDRAFNACRGITSVVLPGNVQTVGFAAFVNCSKLTSIIVKCKTPPTIDPDAFMGVQATLYVPYGTKDLYKTAVGWNKFTDVVEMEPEVIVTDVVITINDFGCGTYCSEYALDFSEVTGLKAYSAIGFNSNTQVVTLARVMTTMAGSGVFFKGEPGDYVVPIIEACHDHTLNLLVGTLEQTVVNSTADGYSNFKFTIAEGSDVPMFYPFKDNTVFSGGKAYLQIPTAWLPIAAQKTVGIHFDNGETTDVDDVFDEVKGKSGEVENIYDLQGCEVENPSRGLYIVNGKKKFVR